jgi:5-methylcytosine-specific restriction endonuclease McrA
MRRKALTDADHRCQHCGIPGEPLDCHHLTYEAPEAIGAREAHDTLAVLCRSCHARIHWGTTAKRKSARERRDARIIARGTVLAAIINAAIFFYGTAPLHRALDE